MTKEFFEEVMRIPTCSSHEDMLADFILEWGKAHGCTAKRDARGNVTLVKGSPNKFYPCLANHMDTVHHDQEALVKAKEYKTIEWSGDTVKAINPQTKKQTGLGMDDQGGCAIALAVLDRLPAAKAVFVVEEEIGMQGSRAFNKSFFDDCAFIISNDSPDRNRATHYSSGVQLYSDEFFTKYLEPICKKHGVSRFNSEPYTDIIQYRNSKRSDNKHLECFNFGNGGYNPHQNTEYAKFSDVNAAEELLYALCTEIPTDVQHTSEIKEEPRTYSYSSSGYSSWWQTMANRQSYVTPRRTSQAEFDFSKKSDETYAFNWNFEKGQSMRNRFVERVGQLLAPDVIVTNFGEAGVRVVGPKAKLMTAFRFAYNYDNDAKFMNWESFIKAVPAAVTAFDQNVKPVMSAQASTDIPDKYNDKTECAISLYFSSDDNCTEFLKRVADLAYDLDLDDDGFSTCDVVGQLGEVKKAYVEYINIESGTHYKTWKSLEKDDPNEADSFFDSVTFDEAFDDDDDFGDDFDIQDDDVIDVTPEDLDSNDDDLPPPNTEDSDDMWSWFDKNK